MKKLILIMVIMVAGLTAFSQSYQGALARGEHLILDSLDISTISAGDSVTYYWQFANRGWGASVKWAGYSGSGTTVELMQGTSQDLSDPFAYDSDGEIVTLSGTSGKESKADTRKDLTFFIIKVVKGSGTAGYVSVIINID